MLIKNIMDFKETGPERIQRTDGDQACFPEQIHFSSWEELDTIATGRGRPAKALGKVVTGAGRV